MSQSSKYSAE